MTGPDPNDDLPDFELPSFDEDAIRKAVRRGVLRVGLSAAAWLLLAVVVGVIGIGAVTAAHTDRFATVVEDGVRAAHPEYDLNNVGCCGGLSPTLTVRAEGNVRGEVGTSVRAAVEVRRSLFGDIDVDAGAAEQSPVREALAREPGSKAATRALVGRLPDTVVASAVVELGNPVPHDAILSLTPARVTAAILTRPFGTDPLVGWPAASDFTDFARWAGELRAGDDDLLGKLGLPPSATLRETARDPQVHAVVVEGATPAQLRALLDNPAVRRMNLAAIAFDPAVAQ